MKNILENIQKEVGIKKVQSLCVKLTKKCNFKSNTDLGNLLDLALMLYLNEYRDYCIQVCDLVSEVEFSGNYTLWNSIDHLHCLKARILREAGRNDDSAELIKYVNRYRHPELYKNGVDWLVNTISVNIENALKFNCESEAWSWRMLRLETLIAYREAGNYPISEQELESMIEVTRKELGY